MTVSSRSLAEFAVAVLACGHDLDPGDDEAGGVPENLTERLDGLVALQGGLSDEEILALLAIGAVSLAMPRTITHAGAPAEYLPALARRLNQATAAGRAGRH
ncbi:hypothetical protein [Kitasatospora sp. NPDC097643]|uniref:hypothetical protein n=1 Tax=Kitasatospora sp. NPDC097643 TaxID=3157230 RepID=UPI0033262AC9